MVERGRLVSEENTFRTGLPRVFAAGDVRDGATTVVEAIGGGRRASYAIDYWLRGHDLDDPQIRRVVSEPQPSFLTIVPFTDDVKEPRAVMGKFGAEERRESFGEYEHGYTHDQAMGEASRCLQCTCEAIGHCDLREAAIEYETTLNMAIDERSIQDNPYVGVNHGYGRDETHSFILRDYSRCIDCGRCAQVCKEIVGAGCYDFIGKGFDSLVTTADFVSPERDAVRSCGRCAETCPVGALMPRPRTWRPTSSTSAAASSAASAPMPARTTRSAAAPSSSSASTSATCRCSTSSRCATGSAPPGRVSLARPSQLLGWLARQPAEPPGPPQ